MLASRHRNQQHLSQPSRAPWPREEPAAALLWGSPPNQSTGLEARSFWDQEMSLFERSEFRHFPKKRALQMLARRAQCSGGLPHSGAAAGGASTN